MRVSLDLFHLRMYIYLVIPISALCQMNIKFFFSFFDRSININAILNISGKIQSCELIFKQYQFKLVL